jgi:hypothetical protein
MSGLLDRPLRRAFWTDFERERYYRVLAENCEKRLEDLRAHPGTMPGPIDDEELALLGARREQRRAKLRTSGL